MEIAFQFSYPRLDAAVSKGFNHLLKAPFCIHPKTGRVCVPIDPNTCQEFDPANVPTLGDLIDDLYSSKEKREGKEYKDTRLREYVRYFKKNFLQPMLKDIRRDKLNNQKKNFFDGF